MELASPRRRVAARSRPRSTRAAASTAACCSTSPTSAPSSINDAAARLARARARLRGRRPHRRADPGAARAPTTRWAASTPTSTGDDPHARPVGRRRGGLRLGARRQPARRQLAARDHRVRPPLRSARGAGRAGRTARAGCVAAVDVRATEEGRIRGMLDAHRRRAPGQMREELADTMYDNAGVFRTARSCEACKAEVDSSCASATTRGHGRRTRARRFNTDLTYAFELGAMLEMADCLVTGALARNESRGAHTRLDYPERDDEQLAAPHARLARRRRGPARLQARHDHRVPARGPQLLRSRMQSHPEDPAQLNPDTGEAGTRASRPPSRSRRDGDAARRARR